MYRNTLAFLFAATLSGVALSDGTLVVGTYEQGLKRLGLDNECKTFFIRNGSNGWEVISDAAADLKDDRVERIRGCLGYASQKDLSATTGQKVLNAVVIDILADDTCSTSPSCNPNYQGGDGRCPPMFQQQSYNNSASRNKGYFFCNSNFANKSFLGGMNFKKPVNAELFQNALRSPSIISAAEGLVREKFEKTSNTVANFNPGTCGDCRESFQAVRVLFDHFYLDAKPELLEKGATSYSIKTAVKELPDWMAKRLSAETAAKVIEMASATWRKAYDVQVKTIVDENVDKNVMKEFVRRYSKQNPTKWNEVDFDGWVPKLAAKIKAIEEREEAEARRNAEIASAEQTKAEAKAQREYEAQQRAQAKRNDAWRATVTMGSDTFCGPVIEIRKPMYKIAVRAQLQGFASEAWLKQSELYPPEYGCRNSNGRLSPTSS